MASNVLTLQNPVFAFYTMCSAIILFKTICMSIYTGFLRVTTKSFAWPEDNMSVGMKPEGKAPHPMVERVRRCHLNDLENNIPFVIVGLLYTFTNPSLFMARLMFGGFTVLRLVHTFIFLNQFPSPLRFTVFTIALTINLIMLFSIFTYVFPKLV